MTDFPFEGTISHGTLREEDLVPAFLSALEDLNAEKADGIRDEYHVVIARLIGVELEPNVEPNVDELSWLMEALYDALDDEAPEGWRFGAHEGDGSDFGFWQEEEEN